MENSDKLKSKCVSAYTYIQLMGEYAADQLEDAIDSETTAEKLEFLSNTTRKFLKKIHDKIDVYISDIMQLSDQIKTKLSPAASDLGSSSSTLVADVKDLKAECSKLLSLKRQGSTEENTDDDFLEIYRIANVTENNGNVIEEEFLQQNEGNVEHKKNKEDTVIVDSDSEKLDTILGFSKSEDERIFEALEALGEDDLDIDSISDVSSQSSKSLSPVPSRRSTTPTSFSAHSSEVSKSKYTDQDYFDIYDIKPSYVLLENRVDLPSNSKLMNGLNKEVQEIDRLTNMNNLDKINSTREKSTMYANKDRSNKDRKSISSDSESDLLTEMDEDELLKSTDEMDLSLSSANEDEDIENHFEDILDKLGESDRGEELDSDTENDLEDTQKKKKIQNKNKKRKHSISSDEEQKKRMCQDPLLIASLSLPLSGEETEELSQKYTRRGKDKTIVCDDDNKEVKAQIKSISDSDMESEEDKPKRKKKRSFTLGERIFISSSDESDDTDCEFVGSVKLEDGDKGRKNIRAIKSKETLAKDTQQALRLEEERIERVNKQKEKMSQTLSQLDENTGAGLVLDVDKDTGKPLIVVDSALTQKLKDHQREGVQFMWDNCYESVERLKTSQGTGCVLAHCMGLGKTFQAIALIHTLFKHTVTATKHVLIVCPLSTVINWKNEFKKMLDGIQDININVKIISDRKTRAQKILTVSNWYKSGGVLIMGYECFAWLVKEFVNGNTENTYRIEYKALLDPGPDLIFCDEGHLIRNKKNNRTKALMLVKTKRRIILTGTPFQNNLEELYQMVQFVKPNLLGTNDEFMNRFGNPIINGGYCDSTARDIKLMQKRSHVLHSYLKDTVQRYESSELKKYLPEKLEYIVLVSLHQVQVKFYKQYLELTSDVPLTSKRFLADYVSLRNVWSHPRMLQEAEKEKPKSKENRKRDDVILTDSSVLRISKDWYRRHSTDDDMHNLEFGNKLLVMLSIIEECEEIGDKIIIFSSFIASLDTIEYFLRKHGTRGCRTWTPNEDYLRMDGSLPLDVRTDYCNSFATNDKIRVFLVSQKIGGMGLNLFAANRMIIMDVNFNPAMDNQSVYRIYRFGQQKKCYIYRLVAMGTMEETVYERSITKSAISARVVDEQQIKRHFNKSELEQMYRFNDINGPRPLPRVPKDDVLAKILQKHSEVFKYHDYQSLLENQLDEQLDEKEQQAAWEEFRVEQENARSSGGTKTLNASNITLSNLIPYDPSIQAFVSNIVQGPVALNVSSSANKSVSKLSILSQDNQISNQSAAISRSNNVQKERHANAPLISSINLNAANNSVLHATKPFTLVYQKRTNNQKILPTDSSLAVSLNSSMNSCSTNSLTMSLIKPIAKSANQQKPTNNQPTPTVSQQQENSNNKSSNNVLILVNDKVIQSDDSGILLPEQQVNEYNDETLPPKDQKKPPKIQQSTMQPQQVPTMTYQKQTQNVQQKQQPKVTIKPVDLNTLVEKGYKNPGPSPVEPTGVTALLQVMQQTDPALLNKLVNAWNNPKNGEHSSNIQKPNTTSKSNTPNHSKLSNPMRRYSISQSLQVLPDTRSAPMGSLSNMGITNNTQKSQQSQNPIDLVVRKDVSNKKTNDVIEILD